MSGMKKLTLLLCGLFLMVTACTAQTIGGDTSLNSKTWFWSGLSGPFPSTALLTPTVTSDYLISLYVNSPNIVDGSEICAQIAWTDELSSTNIFPDQNSGSPQVNIACTTDNSVRAYQGSVTFPIHVLANTTVSLSTSEYDGGSHPTYNMVVTKIKVNP